MKSLLGTLESSDPSGHTLRLFLEQTADRVAQRIEVLNPAGQKLAELRSVEGTSRDEWPVSPALQSCSLQEIRPGQTAAFLVGMSGKSHWSASVEAIPGEGALDFDFACRVHSLPQWLGSTYAMTFLPQNGVTHFQESNTGITVEVYGSDDSVCGVQVSGQKVQLACQQTPVGFPTTLRWQYRIKLWLARRLAGSIPTSASIGNAP